MRLVFLDDSIQTDQLLSSQTASNNPHGAGKGTDGNGGDGDNGGG